MSTSAAITAFVGLRTLDSQGVVICVTSLVMALAQDHLDAYVVCYTKAVDRLHKLVIGHEYSATYAYYKVPSPWLQVKLLRLLQYYPPSGMGSPPRNYNLTLTRLRGSFYTFRSLPGPSNHHEQLR